MFKETLCFWRREYLVYKVLRIEDNKVITPHQKYPVLSSLLQAEGELEIGEDWGIPAAFGGVIHVYRDKPWTEALCKVNKDLGFYVVKAYADKKDLKACSSIFYESGLGVERVTGELGFTKIRIDEKDLFELQEIAKVKQ